MDPALKSYLDDIKASVQSNGDKMNTITQRLDTQTAQLSDLCSWKPDLEDRFTKLQEVVADLQRAQPTPAAATSGTLEGAIHGPGGHGVDILPGGSPAVTLASSSVPPVTGMASLQIPPSLTS